MRESTKRKYLQAIPLYEQGMSLTQICKTLHVERTKLTGFLRDCGYKVVNPTIKRKLNTYYFKTIDTEEKAYWLGFLYADGCICEKWGKKPNGERRLKSLTFGIALKAEDKEHLCKFAKSLDHENPMFRNKKVHLNGKEFQSVDYTVGCTEMAKDLIELGCFPRKSLILEFPSEQQVPTHLLKHFIRGYFDGDGSVSIKKNKTCDTLRMSLMGTEAFIRQLVLYLRLEEKDYSISSRDGNDITVTIHFNKDATLRIAKEMYSEAKVYLDRKYDLVLPFIENAD